MEEWLHSFSNGNVFLSQCNGTPRSKNCVYLITCSKCGIQYVGETGNTLLTRFTQHRYVLRKKNTHTYLVRHFLSHGWESVRTTVTQANPRWTARQRRKAERVWIAKLDTVHPKGLNEKRFDGHKVHIMYIVVSYYCFIVAVVVVTMTLPVCIY